MPAITGAIIQADAFVATAAAGAQVALGGLAVTDVALRKYASATAILVKGDNSAVADLVMGALTVGGHIVFPASQNASSNVNTLDDYEEGTWTPSLGGTTTYTIQTGHYTKVGRLVIATFSLHINAIGTGSTSNISGLPIASAGLGVIGSVGWFNALATNVVWMGLQGDAGTNFTVYSLTAAAAAPGLSAIFGAGTRVQGAIAYFTAT